MDKKKILFLDLDDTLLNQEKKITAGNKAAILAALSSGVRIVICTGRPLTGAAPILASLSLTRPGCYAICCNGTQIRDCHENQWLYQATLPLEDVRTIFREADKAGIHAQTYDSRYLLCRSMDEETLYYKTRTRAPLKIRDDLPSGLTEEPPKIILIDLHDHAKLEAFRSAHEEWAKGKVSMVFSNAMYLEFIKEGNSKGAAIRRLLAYLKLPAEASVGAGDSENDIPMLKECGIGCAMANATQACKNAADYITERDCNHDGVAEILEKYFL